MDGLKAFAVAGYSLGGNLALKLAGDFGAAPPKELRAVCAVSPTMDLAVCVDALEEKQNAIYQWHFVRNLKRRMRRKAAAWPGKWKLDALPRIRSIREFDDAYTAPSSWISGRRRLLPARERDARHRQDQHPGADHHGRRRSVRSAGPIQRARVTRNRNITLELTPHGGHCGFVEEPHAGYDGYWAEREIVRFLASHCRV